MANQEIPSTTVVESVKSIWGIDLRVGGCPSCKQVFLVPENWLGKVCPGCFKSCLEEQPGVLRPESPELVVPFRLAKPQIQTILSNFIKGIWLAPDDFNTANLLNRLIPIFWPMWLLDIDATGIWRAEAGFDYQVKSSLESYSGSDWHSQERIENRTRWEYRTGNLRRRYENIAVPALETHSKISAALGNYQMDQSIPYQTTAVERSLVRVPDLPPQDSWQLALRNIAQAAEKECQVAAGAQHSRNFSLQAEYHRQHWTQILLPLYVTYYTDDQNQPRIVSINGQTGQIHGLRLASQKKGWLWAGVSAAIALVLFIIGLILVVIPPLAPVGALFIVLGFMAGAFAIVPAAWPWQWNRRQNSER